MIAGYESVRSQPLDTNEVEKEIYAFEVTMVSKDQ